jgi:hypothetical protein
MIDCCPGKREHPLHQWDDLCADVRPVILGKLSPREIASVAPTCREFRKAFLASMQAERARLISVGEQLYGDKMFTGFVDAFRRLLRRDFEAYPGFVPFGQNILLLNADGGADVVTWEEWVTIRATCFLSWIKRTSRPGGLTGGLWTDLPGSGDSVEIDVNVYPTPEEAVQLSFQVITGGARAREAAMGFVLAICEGNPEDVPVARHGLFNRVTLDLGVLEGDTGKRLAEDLVGPLRFLAEYVSYNKPVCHVLPYSKGGDTGPADPLGNLVVRF